jgi:2-succinyl-5-enolpyruvyl-6-hydroxy-3-cyclohexene-1-carboxylate synthase
MSTEADVSLAAMSALVDGLVFGGVRHACVSPGSRSTPIALALARDPRVRVHVHLDERCSGFFALGLAKASGAPVAVACTSGTAAANLFPAVVEAAMSRVPLVVLTADRPPELRGVGANQTIDQVRLYGGYVRAFVDAPVPGDAPSVEGWRRRGSDLADASASPPPRPIHANLPFREPLVPGVRGPQPSVPGPAPEANAGVGPEHGDVAAFVEEISGVERGLVYAGGLRAGGADVVALAERLGWPLAAEPQSGARRTGALSAGSLLLASERFVDAHVPDVLLQVGAAPTSRPGLALARRAPRLLVVDPDAIVADPFRRAAHRVVAQPAAVLRAITARADRLGGWAAEWRAASDRVRAVVDATLDAWPEPFEGRVARDVTDTAPGGSVLAVGSSMPIRDADAFARPRDDVRILANRGASGIDGFVSTALGIAASGIPTTALLGDLTLLHDVGGLIWSARRGHHAVLVTLDNGGGAIFSLLEQATLPEADDLFVTPHGVDLGAIAAAAGAAHRHVDRADELVDALRAGHEARGVTVIQVVIEAERDRARRDEIRRVVDDAIR